MTQDEGATGGVEAAREKVAQMRDDAWRAASESAEFLDRVRDREFTASSRNGRATATVGFDGLLRRLHLTESAASAGPAALSRSVLEAHDRALLELRRVIEVESAATFTDAPDLGAVMRAQYRAGIPSRVDALDVSDR